MRNQPLINAKQGIKQGDLHVPENHLGSSGKEIVMYNGKIIDPESHKGSKQIGHHSCEYGSSQLNLNAGFQVTGSSATQSAFLLDRVLITEMSVNDQTEVTSWQATRVVTGLKWANNKTTIVSADWHVMSYQISTTEMTGPPSSDNIHPLHAQPLLADEMIASECWPMDLFTGYTEDGECSWSNWKGF